MSRSLEALAHGFGGVLIWLAGAIWQAISVIGRGIGEAILQALHGAGRAIGRLLARAAPWVGGAGIAYWLMQNQPGVFAQLLQIGILVGAIWFMIRSLFRKPTKRSGERTSRRGR